MKEKGCIEIITFGLVDNVTEQQAYNGFKVLEAFNAKYDGYYGMDIVQIEAGKWTLNLRFASKELEKEVSNDMMASDEVNQFKMLINPETVVKNVYPYFNIE